MKKNSFAGLAAAILCLAFVISGCDSTRHESTKGVVELSDASVGDIVVFGDIRWYVIGKTEAGYTLLSEKPVIKQCFRKAGYGISTSTWEESTVRAWLNDKFYNTFSEEEKTLIAKTHNINADNSEYGTSGGNDTDDYIYLLSVDEANPLDDSMRKCGTWDSPFHQWWWLRSPGANTSYVTYVGKGKDGVIDPHGDIASNEYGAVRPALNLRLADHTVPTSINRTSVEVEAELKAISDSQIDDVVVFGRYTWYVTDKTDGICTLLCQGPVAYMPYNDSKTDITWENSSLRSWLNEDFYNSKFSAGEKTVIEISHNTFAEDDSQYGMDCGNETDDRVYLLSYTEAMAVSDDIRDCGVSWWVRSPGKRQDTAVFISSRSPDLMGTDVGYDFAIRPAIRIRYSDRVVDK